MWNEMWCLIHEISGCISCPFITESWDACLMQFIRNSSCSTCYNYTVWVIKYVQSSSRHKDRPMHISKCDQFYAHLCSVMPYYVFLKGGFRIFIDFFFKGPTKTAPQEKNCGTTEKGLSWFVTKLWGWQLRYNSAKWQKMVQSVKF